MQNRLGLPVRQGSTGIFYCGRLVGRTALRGSDGQCGPTNGPQCFDCRTYTGMTPYSMMCNVIGVPVNLGSNGRTFYCGRFLGKATIPGSDGRCGPNDGPCCPDCAKGIGGRPAAVIRNADGVRTFLSDKNGWYYCARVVGRNALPGSDGRCGPTDGPQCNACHTIAIDPSLPVVTAPPQQHQFAPPPKGVLVQPQQQQQFAPPQKGIPPQQQEFAPPQKGIPPQQQQQQQEFAPPTKGIPPQQQQFASAQKGIPPQQQQQRQQQFAPPQKGVPPQQSVPPQQNSPRQKKSGSGFGISFDIGFGLGSSQLFGSSSSSPSSSSSRQSGSSQQFGLGLGLSKQFSSSQPPQQSQPPRQSQQSQPPQQSQQSQQSQSQSQSHPPQQSRQSQSQQSQQYPPRSAVVDSGSPPPYNSNNNERKPTSTISTQPNSPSSGNPAEEPCVVCLENPRNASMVHGETGHQVCCLTCAQKLKADKMPCPLCRQPIELVIKNFV